MILRTLILGAILCSSAQGQGSALGEAQIPEKWVLGQGFRVQISYAGGPEGGILEAWQLTSAAFELHGKPLGERSNTASIPLAPGDTLSVILELSTRLTGEASFQLALAGSKQAATSVRVYQPLEAGLDLMSIEANSLSNLLVLMKTSRGEMLFEVWPEVAPNHVRNWLDLVYTQFYDGVQFHRVSPSFMIQGGCPNTRTDRRDLWGRGVGPRTLKLELSERKHDKGVLSMARGNQLDSGSSQFFVITRTSPQLDGQYSTFGKLLSGYDVLAKIANEPGRMKNGTIRPDRPQRIVKAIVVRELLSKK